MNVGHWVAGDSRNWNLALQGNDDGSFQVEHRDRAGGTPHRLVAVTLPRDRWFDLDIHATLGLSDGDALTEVFIDGVRVGATTRRNMTFNAPVHLYNAGLPYFYPGNGDVTVYFDAPRIASP